jgi:hypothetical protein
MYEDKTRAAFMRSGMGWLRRGGWQLLLAIISILGITGCGKHSVTPLSPYPAKITVTPSPTVSLQAGGTLNFTASAQNAAGTTLRATFTFRSSNTSILNLSVNGVACAGRWDSTFSICTPDGIGMVEVTATVLNVTSQPTYVFVHPPIDNITVQGILPTNQAQFVQEPCLPQGESMTIQANAYSQGVDITQSVGPFTWSANNSSVVRLTPIISNPNQPYNFATYQATATAVIPGITQIYATASGVTSTSFVQPTLPVNSTYPNPPSPVTFDFFETCPIQNIVLELGEVGSQQTSFVGAKGNASETVVATLTDVLGNSSLPNTDGAVQLSKIPLTWTGTQPQVVGPGSGCTQSCSLALPSAGAGAITASCSPPTCNVGFPYVPPAFSTPQNLAACATYLSYYFPQISSCEPFIPLPVYASPFCSTQAGAANPCPLTVQQPVPAAISGLVTGATSAATILAASFGCGSEPPSTCTTGLYSFPSAKASVNAANITPYTPTSLRYDINGDKIYMGSDYGALAINPANLGTSTSPFTPLGTVTGNILGISTNGTSAVFSDTFHPQNQVYIVNTSTSTVPATALNISGASVAAFSPDGLRAYIFGYDSGNNPDLYIYSALQSLQSIPLPALTTVNSIAFSTNAAFAYVVEPSYAGGGPVVTVYNNCVEFASNPQIVADQFALTSPPIAFKVLPDGIHFIALEANGTFDYITATIAGVTPIATQLQYATALCPQTVTHTVQNYSLDQGSGNFTPIDFFTSADGSLLYVLASDRSSILIYNFGLTQTTGGIQLISTNSSSVTPLADAMSVDAGTIVVAGSDGLIHEIATANGGFDSLRVSIPDLPNYLNPFCTFTPASGPCTLDFVAVKP